MRKVMIGLMVILCLASVMAFNTNVTQIDNSTFLINVSNDIVLDYMKVEVYDISSNTVDVLEAFETNSIEYYIDYLPYGNYSIFVTASDTMTVPFEFKALVDTPINDTNVTLPVNETNTTEPVVVPTSSGGGGRRHKPAVKVEPVTVVEPTPKPIESKLSTKPYWENLEQEEVQEQVVNETLEVVPEPEVEEEVGVIDPCTDSSLTNQEKIQLHGCKPEQQEKNYSLLWIILIIVIVVVAILVGILYQTMKKTN
jgi:hypothetical protein